MAWSAALPAVLAINPVGLILAILVCVIVELISGIAHAMAGRRTQAEVTYSEDVALLKVEIVKTNYPEKFVENSKLQRQLIKVEKELERLRGERAARRTKVQRWTRWLRLAAYGALVAAHWGQTAIRFTPAYVTPLGAVAGGPLQGTPQGGVSIAGVVVLFWWGLGGRFGSS
ncbi:hypothetical protein JKP88DRAFT_333776 [Tribonema minus]|uniref:Uncharacterized protein n=1 Tax=Tribonema minus TaxID=303371 RepID=A0A835YKR9_9STRA|nr:hypothetical protein JKP88DRAFT_333776 [Tribonema minus]